MYDALEAVPVSVDGLPYIRYIVMMDRAGHNDIISVSEPLFVFDLGCPIEATLLHRGVFAPQCRPLPVSLAKAQEGSSHKKKGLLQV
jgi:hypothetical protein